VKALNYKLKDAKKMIYMIHEWTKVRIRKTQKWGDKTHSERNEERTGNEKNDRKNED
jgi:hypothetical protein